MCVAILATVAMIEDDKGRLGNFIAYARERGDILPQASQFAGDLEVIAEGSAGRSEVDLFLLDLRLPELTKELVTTLPRNRAIRGSSLARWLLANPATSSTPVVVYTQFALDPEIDSELDGLLDREKFPNVVEVFRTRPGVRETIRCGLTHVRHLQVQVVPARGYGCEFEVRGMGPVSRTLLLSGRFLLNGRSPEIITELGNDALWVGFEARAKHEFDDNYLMIEAAGRKSIFLV